MLAGQLHARVELGPVTSLIPRSKDPTAFSQLENRAKEQGLKDIKRPTLVLAGEEEPGRPRSRRTSSWPTISRAPADRTQGRRPLFSARAACGVQRCAGRSSSKATRALTGRRRGIRGTKLMAMDFGILYEIELSRNPTDRAPSTTFFSRSSRRWSKPNASASAISGRSSIASFRSSPIAQGARGALRRTLAAHQQNPYRPRRAPAAVPIQTIRFAWLRWARRMNLLCDGRMGSAPGRSVAATSSKGYGDRSQRDARAMEERSTWW